jgi:hypothetical protein
VAGQVHLVGELVEKTPSWARNLDQLVECPSKISKISEVRPLDFDPSMRLRALLHRFDVEQNT